MDRRSYFLSLFCNDKLVCEGDEKFYYITKVNDEFVMMECKRSDNSVTLLKRKTVVDDYAIVDENEIERSVKIAISNDGSRWEGDWYDEKPFGFGSIYDGEGNRIYSGFMFNGKKVVYGIEFFVDTHTVDYCGNFWNNQRHGRGSSYDRNGNKLYEGEWRCGRNDKFKDKIVINNDNCEDVIMHDFIKELEIGENCYNEIRDELDISDYPYLEKIVVKKNSLQNVKALRISNNERLKSIDIHDNAFRNVKNVKIDSNSNLLLDHF